MIFKDWCNEVHLTIYKDNSVFQEVLSNKKFIDFGISEGNPSKDTSIPIVSYHAIGSIDDNKLFLELSFNKNKYYGSINSGVLYPKMIDRCFGIDQQDGYYLNMLSDVMCLMFLYDKKMSLEEAIEYKELNKAK